MTPARYVRLSRAASFLYLTAIFILVGLAIAIVGSIASPLIQQALSGYGVLGALVWAAMVLVGPSLVLSVAIGAFGKCPSCGERFVSMKGGPRPKASAISRDVRRSLRTAFGYECRCEGCNRDALDLLKAMSPSKELAG